MIEVIEHGYARYYATCFNCQGRKVKDKELDNEEIDFINGEHLEQGWDYE